MPESDYNAGQTGFSSHDSWGIASPNQRPGDHVPYPQWFDSRSTDVSPSYGNTVFPMNQIRWLASSPYEHLGNVLPIQHSANAMCEPSHLPTPGEDNYYTGKIGVSPSYGNTHLPMNPTQWSMPNTYEQSPYEILSAQDQGHHNASNMISSVNLHPDLPLDEGIVSGLSGAVVGKSLGHSARLQETEHPSRSRRFGYVSSAGTLTSERREETRGCERAS